MTERPGTMDYIQLLKDSWAATWRSKVLWLFGLLGGSGSGLALGWDAGSPPQASSSSDAEAWKGIEHIASKAEIDQFANQLESWIPFIIAGAIGLVVLALVFFVLRVAAMGGLVELSRTALEGAEVRARDGWRTGFRNWLRVIGTIIILALPAIAIGAVLSGIIALLALPYAVSGVGIDSPAWLGFAMLIPPVAIGMTLLGLLLHLLEQIALRLLVLRNMSPIDSIKTAWELVWAKKGVFTMWLLLILLSLGVGLLTALVAIPFVVAIVLTAIAQAWAVLAVVVFALVAVVALIWAIFMAFSATAWTALFERSLLPDVPEATA